MRVRVRLGRDLPDRPDVAARSWVAADCASLVAASPVAVIGFTDAAPA